MRMRYLLHLYFLGCKNKRKKMNPTISNMKLFLTLVDGLFKKQLNNITKYPTSDVASAQDLPICLVF